jgi:hypothetical protein
MCVVIMFRHSPEDRANIAAVQAAVATATNHFTALDNENQEIYFTCTPYQMWRQIEISPSSWAETLPLFSVIEVRKRSKWDSSTRAVREQAAVSGPNPPRPPRPTPVQQRTAGEKIALCALVLGGVYLYTLSSPLPRKASILLGSLICILAA